MENRESSPTMFIDWWDVESSSSLRSPGTLSLLGGSLAHYNPLSPVAEEGQEFTFDEVLPDHLLDKALNAIVGDEVNPLLSSISGGLDITKTYDIVSGSVVPPELPTSPGSVTPSLQGASTSRFSLASRTASRDTVLLATDYNQGPGDNVSLSYGSVGQAITGNWGSTDQQAASSWVGGPVVRATLLHVAVIHKALKCAKFLVHLGAPLEATESYRGDTALHLGVRSGDLQLTRQLIEEGADIQAHNSRGDTPLHVAAAAGRVAITKLLLGEGADILARNKYDETPWEQADKNGSGSNIVCADLLLTRYRQLRERVTSH